MKDHVIRDPFLYVLVIDDHPSIQVLRTVTDHRDGLKSSIWILVVQLRCPVVGKILLDWACRASGFPGLIVIHGKSKAIATSNLVYMTSNLTRVYHGVCALFDKIVGTVEANVC